MLEKTIIHPLTEKPKALSSKQLKSRKIEGIKHITTFINDSSINLRTKSGINVFVYVKPTLENIDNILELGTDKIDYRFNGINSNILKDRFLKVTTNIKPIIHFNLSPDIYVYIYSSQNKRRIYDVTEKLHIDYAS